ncbi:MULTISPECIES: S41 family peptidase [unclassified Pseudoalteromonas]|uniref:S41 family peptidase n=1 Tax=unclassified Pseudoalteromonas TaxID=194690 RepID=UPI0020972A39|nr:S41 family peptidase [Pseudoalteromonas sp. XMcav2-N]MCO7190807.1 S41 family peptidase [Pseudoalteromonas sp. XMcav2-N]
MNFNTSYFSTQVVKPKSETLSGSLKRLLGTSLAGALMVLCGTQAAKADETLGHFSAVYSAEAIQADINQWVHWVHTTHPDLTHSIKDIDEFYERIDTLRYRLDKSMTGEQVWREFASLNSIMADGHLSIGDGTNTQWRQWVAQGAKLFPFEVALSVQGLKVVSELGGAPSAHDGKYIKEINGVPVTEVVATLLQRIEGDNVAFRSALLARRFAMTYRLMYGAKSTFTLKFHSGEPAESVHVAALNKAPVSIKQRTFDDNFNLKLLDNQQALLTIKQFGWNEPDAYFQFMAETFERLNKAQTKHLMIDISDNTGGDDVYWKQGILKYIATTPYRHGSTYQVRILEKYRDPGEVIGSVLSGELTKMTEPDTDPGLLFKGKVSVLTGPLTYSSSVLFANTIQDYGFATLVGTPTGGRSSQSGGIQFLTLKHTGIRAVTPRFILDRPSGKQQMTPVQPDIVISREGVGKAEFIAKALSAAYSL